MVAGLALRHRDVKSLVPQVAVAGFTGVTAAALQIGMPANMRGQLSAIYLLVFNLVGLSLGPTAVAVFNDYVLADEAMIGWCPSARLRCQPAA